MELREQRMTIEDVAAAAGVSKATVSRVINRPHLVSASTMRKVRNAMREMNFAPNGVAQSMRMGKTKTVGVVIPEPRNPFYSTMLCAIETELKKRDYMMLICPSSGAFEEEKKYIARMLQRRVDGILFFTYNNSREQIGYFQKITRQIPFVLMDESRDDIEINQVATNGYEGVRAAVRYFLRKGHTKIGCFCGKTEAGTNRYFGYLDALRENGLEGNGTYVFRCGFSVQEGYEAARLLSAMKDRPTAVVCVADSIAVGVIKCLTDHKIRIPQEIEVIGFDNIELSTIVTPSLSTVSQEVDILCEQAVRLLMEMIDHPKRTLARKILVPGQLLLRESTR